MTSKFHSFIIEAAQVFPCFVVVFLCSVVFVGDFFCVCVCLPNTSCLKTIIKIVP